MSSSPDLPLGARVLLGATVVTLAWALPRTLAVATATGPTVVTLSAGLAALATLALARVPLGLWPPQRRRQSPELLRSAAVGVALAAALVAGDNVLRARYLLNSDPAAVLALLAGAGAWGAALAVSRQRDLLRWYCGAAGAALLPVAASVGVLRPVVSGGYLVSGLIFYSAADAAVALVTEELAFRRALLGAPASAGLPALAGAAAVFGLWHAVQPSYTSAPVAVLVGTALGGFVTGCLYVLSGSLPVAAVYHALHNAPLKALAGAPVVPGQAARAGGLALTLTAALALALGWMVYRRGRERVPGLS